MESATFRKVSEKFGGLSNMAGGFPLSVEGVPVATSEALYQACRFPHRPEIQELILASSSPMTAKMKSKPHRRETRPDWSLVRVPIMKWCLRVKLAQNWKRFSELLLSTGDVPIVEDSRTDSFWGAKPDGGDFLVGENALGRLLMELRLKLHDAPEELYEVPPLPIAHFMLLGRQIGVVGRKVYPPVNEIPVPQGTLFG
ncbi:NADAR family protein [Insolitispirillum peregrinum]|nr:NADAR family protein [Insolitispirillum peregrinum]